MGKTSIGSRNSTADASQFPPHFELGFLIRLLDSGRAWAGVTRLKKDAGLYEINLSNGKALKLPEPEPQAFARITDIFSVGTYLAMVQMKGGNVELQFAKPSQDAISVGSATGPSAPVFHAGFASVELEDNNLILRWNGPGILQTADEVTGPWRDHPNATSPHPVPVTKQTEFCRIVLGVNGIQ